MVVCQRIVAAYRRRKVEVQNDTFQPKKLRLFFTRSVCTGSCRVLRSAERGSVTSCRRLDLPQKSPLSLRRFSRVMTCSRKVSLQSDSITVEKKNAESQSRRLGSTRLVFATIRARDSESFFILSTPEGWSFICVETAVAECAFMIMQARM